MTEVHAAFGAYREMIPLAHGDGFQLVRATSEDGERILALLPGSMERARLELSHARRIAGPAVVVPTPGRGPGAVALVELPGLEDSTPLAEGSELPPAALRHGLVVLLSALSQAHARGLLHGRVGSATILAGPSGEFHLIGWADAVDVEDESVDLSKTTASVSRDIEGVARALLPLLRVATRAHHASPDTAAMGVVEGVALVPEHGITRDFTRVLSRMLSQDPREVYAGAAEALEDLGEHDLSIGDGELPVDWPTAVDVTGIVRHVIREAVRDDDETQYEAVVEVVGPSGSGRTATLRRVASAIRDDGGLVLHISGSDPGPWGPFTTLTRRLLNLVSADAEPLCEFDVEIATLLGEPCEAGDVAGVIGAVAAALGELLEVVFQRDLGVVLLDDAGQLGAASRQVWQSIVRWRHRRHIEGKGLPLAFVATSDGPAAPEMGLPTRVVELVPISRESLRQELCNVLWEPDLAPDLAEYLHAATEGWPRSLQACWADLVRDGVLQRNESRYHVHRSLDGAPAWSEAIVRALGQAYAEHGHQVRRFLEVLAAAGRRPLERRVCSTLSELSGPSLWRAAEAVEATDLVERVGTAWRLRSQSVRARVYSAIPLDRRRALHRELLAHYERLDQPDLNAQAEHARAGSHPRAADLTERAVRECLATGHLKEAVQHVRDLERHADSVGHRPDLWILAAEVLGSAGAVTEALRVTDRAMASNRLSVREELEVKLLCARLELTFDRPENVISIDVPYCPGAEEQICALRWFRAAALVTLGDLPRASREARLARAELDAPTKNPLVRFAEARYEAQRGRTERNWVSSRMHTLVAMRASKRLGDPFLFAEQLVRYAAACRLSQRSEYFNVIDRVSALVRQNRLEFTYVHTRFVGECDLKRRGRDLREYAMAVVRSRQLCRVSAERCGHVHLAIFLCLRHVLGIAVDLGPPPARLRREVENLPPTREWSEFLVLNAGYPALATWIYYGNRDRIEELMPRVASLPEVSEKRRVVWTKLAYDAATLSFVDTNQLKGEFDRLAREYEAGRINQHERPVLPALLAALIALGVKERSGAWTLSRMQQYMAIGYDAWSGVRLALAICIYWSRTLQRSEWDALVQSIRSEVSPLPVAWEWEREFVLARDHMLRGDPVKALEHRQRALLALQLAIQRASDGERARFAGYIQRFGAELGVGSNLSSRSAEPPTPTRYHAWIERVVRVLENSDVSTWVCVRSPALLREIARRLAVRGHVLMRTREDEGGATGRIALVSGQGGELPRSARAVLSLVPAAYFDGALELSMSKVVEVDADGSGLVMALIEDAANRLSEPKMGAELHRWMMCYGWPGGPHEVRAALAAVQDAPGHAIDSARRAVSRYNMKDARSAAAVRADWVMRAAYLRTDGISMATLAWLTGYSRRSLQRTCRELCEAGALRSTGTTSAVRYWLEPRHPRVTELLYLRSSSV